MVACTAKCLCESACRADFSPQPALAGFWSLDILCATAAGARGSEKAVLRRGRKGAVLEEMPKVQGGTKVPRHAAQLPAGVWISCFGTEGTGGVTLEGRFGPRPSAI